MSILEILEVLSVQTWVAIGVAVLAVGWACWHMTPHRVRRRVTGRRLDRDLDEAVRRADANSHPRHRG